MLMEKVIPKSAIPDITRMSGISLSGVKKNPLVVAHVYGSSINKFVVLLSKLKV